MIPTRIISIGLFTLFSLSVLSVQAAEPSVCKGLEQNQCSNNNACNWINPYKRSDGKRVDGYCRAKPARKSSQAKPASKAS